MNTKPMRYNSTKRTQKVLVRKLMLDDDIAFVAHTHLAMVSRFSENKKWL